MDDLIYAAGCVALMGVIYFGWEIFFGNAKYRRWERAARRRSKGGA